MANSSATHQTSNIWEFGGNPTWNGIPTSQVLLNALKKINILSTLGNFSWDTHPRNMILVYKTIIRPKLDWGSFLFHGCSKSTKKLEVLHNSAIRKALGCMSIILRRSTFFTIWRQFKPYRCEGII